MMLVWITNVIQRDRFPRDMVLECGGVSEVQGTSFLVNAVSQISTYNIARR